MLLIKKNHERQSDWLICENKLKGFEKIEKKSWEISRKIKVKMLSSTCCIILYVNLKSMTYIPTISVAQILINYFIYLFAFEAVFIKTSADAKTFRTAALSQAHSLYVYCTLVWHRSDHTCSTDRVLYDAMCIREG